MRAEDPARRDLRAGPAFSDAHLNRTFDEAPFGMALADLERRLLRVNGALCEMLGRAEQELVGRTLDHITHHDDLDQGARARATMVVEDSRPFLAVRRFRRPDGRIVHGRVWTTLVRAADGTPSHLVAHIEDVTEAHEAHRAAEEARRAAEEARRAAEEARRLLDESQATARTGSWSYNLETREISWSDGQFRLHGLEPGPVAPTVEEHFMLVHPDDRERVAASIAAKIEDTPESFTGEYRVIHPDGSVHTLVVRAGVIAADPATGRAARVSGTNRDVTAERAAQRARRATEQRHRRLLASLPDAMVVLYDDALRCVLIQGGLAAELGIECDDHVGQTPAESGITPAQGERLLAALRRALAGETTALELHGARSFHIDCAPYLDEDGRLAGAFTVWRDMTARRARERENRMLATMVEQSEDAILAKDRHGIITAWNAGAERLYGYTRAEAVGRPITLIAPPGAAGETHELLAIALSGRSVQRDTRRRHKDGRIVDVSLSVSPLRDPSGAVIGASAIAHDIGERIRAQQARREIEERLRVTVEHAPIGVALVALDERAPGRLLSANHAFAALLCDPDPVAGGVSLTDVAHPDDVAALRSDLTLLASHGQARVETEVRFVASDGTVAWRLLTGAAVPAGDSAPRLAVVHALDIGERKRFEDRLQHLADHDTLTGLYNRRRFEQELTRAVATVTRYRRPAALLLLDLDGFKHVNDELGHSLGDELIARVGTTLRETLRESDVIGRLGGDEFALILPSVTGQEAFAVGEKVLDAIRRHGVVLSDQRPAGVSASVGVVPFDGDNRLDAEELMLEADVTMYRAKDAGRNRVVLASHEDGPSGRLTVRRSWHTRLRAALAGGGFELFAQAIRPICAPDGERYELLLRMRDDDGALVTPATFLYNAERFDLVQEIDRWVFAEALQLLDRYTNADRHITLSVNMSGKTMSDPQIIDDLTAMVAACPIPRDRLIVEVTETAAIVNIERARDVAAALRGLGCRFALDDFGAGFASFYYLKHLDFDYVKIDGEFVRSLGSDPTDQLVIRAVVDLARGLGAETIAEFVGDDPTVARLRELGVDYGQGYHLGRPAPIADVLGAAAQGTTPVPHGRVGDRR